MAATSAAASRQTSAEPSGASTPVISQSSATVEKSPDDQGKLRTLLSILKRFIGVADIAAVRFSLPAQLLEPLPNLEYWHYLDRPEAFASIGDSDDALGRMLGAMRFWFTKDLKYVKGKPCKPYNSVLGEFFRCTWVVDPKAPSPTLLGNTTPQTTNSNESVKINFLTEQTSHHPPVSAYYIDCPSKGISAKGFDQLSANFTGTRIKVAPGNYNHGIFITLHNRDDEQYNLSHPTAHLGGLLRGSPSISVADTCYVTCPKTGLKAILEYLDEGWVGKAQNRVRAIIYKYDPNNDTKTRIKDVSESDILARVEGCWHEQIHYTLGGKAFDKSEKTLVIDLRPLLPQPKLVPPPDSQLPNESHRFWESVTNAIVAKQYGAATSAKQEIEERQRQKAADRKSRNAEWRPRFFTDTLTPAGKPDLSAEGQAALAGLEKGDYHLEPSAETAA